MYRESPFLLCDVLCFLSVNPNPFSLEREGLPHLPICVCHPTDLFAHSRNRGLAPVLRLCCPLGPVCTPPVALGPDTCYYCGPLSSYFEAFLIVSAFLKGKKNQSENSLDPKRSCQMSSPRWCHPDNTYVRLNPLATAEFGEQFLVCVWKGRLMSNSLSPSVFLYSVKNNILIKIEKFFFFF